MIAELQDRIISQHIARGRLQVEVDYVVEEYHHEIKGKNDLIVNLQAQNDNPSSEIGSLARATNDRGCRYLIQTKNNEIADLNAHLNNLRGGKWQNERARDREAMFTAATAYYSERVSEEFKIRLRTANKERCEALRKSARVWKLLAWKWCRSSHSTLSARWAWRFRPSCYDPL